MANPADIDRTTGATGPTSNRPPVAVPSRPELLDRSRADDADDGSREDWYSWWTDKDNQWQEPDRWFADDGAMGLKYRRLIYDSVRYNWDPDGGNVRMAWEIEQRGLLDWMNQREEAWYEMRGGKPSSGPSYYGSRGGGGRSGPTAEEKEEAILSNIAALRNQAGILGIPMDDAQLRALAEQAFDGKWSIDQVTDMMLEGFDWVNAKPGQLEAGVDEVTALAAQYLMPVSETTARDLSLRVSSGELDINGIRNMFNEQARIQYGFLSDTLDQGITPADFFAPLRDVAANTLELAPDSMNLMDDKVRDMFTVTNEDGTTRAASLTEVQKRARQDSRFADTAQASDRMAAMGATLARAFGDG